MDRSHPPRPARRRDAPHPAAELLFCAVCQVSITAAEMARGAARRAPRGRVLCPVCVSATPEQRAARRAALELEFADDAPIGATATAAAPVAAPVPIARPVPVAEPVPHPDGPTLEARVAELERTAFRMRQRLDAIDAKLDALLRRLGG